MFPPISSLVYLGTQIGELLQLSTCSILFQLYKVTSMLKSKESMHSLSNSNCSIFDNFYGMKMVSFSECILFVSFAHVASSIRSSTRTCAELGLEESGKMVRNRPPFSFETHEVKLISPTLGLFPCRSVVRWSSRFTGYKDWLRRLQCLHSQRRRSASPASVLDDQLDQDLQPNCRMDPCTRIDITTTYT